MPRDIKLFENKKQDSDKEYSVPTNKRLLNDEYNILTGQTRCLIETSGQGIDSTVDVNSASVDPLLLSKAVSNYVHCATYYKDISTVTNTYIISPVLESIMLDQNDKIFNGANKINMQGVSALLDGMIVRFRPIRSNTGASTVEIKYTTVSFNSTSGAFDKITYSLGVKSIKKSDGIANLSASDIQLGYDIELRYNASLGVFLLIQSCVASFSIVPIANGGTGATTQQGAINALAGSQVGASGKFLRSDGTNISLFNIQASDVPILNQNTTGSAGSAAKLTTQRKISGVLFDGTKDIDIPIPTKVSQLQNDALFTTSTTHAYPNGDLAYMVYRNGTLIYMQQSGYIASTGIHKIFNISFPNGCTSVVVGNADAQGSGVDNVFAESITLSSFYVASKGNYGNISGYPCRWIATGW